ncbi:Nitroreductase [Pseudomassariella vexata]|uniref:Nitroreductase n=1 Tax=Pseudomassariella vexata TaxID=1141098 RepID=A0A1Y2EJH0_9PEZI|nr:Nitroreductase [Pseudomassariella vexata]ORY71454.1 Nitroreductase [Pseudomassariella vexata]
MANINTLVQARYGSATTLSLAAGGVEAANPTLATLLQHKSTRNFSAEHLEPGTLEIIVAAGQSAATSSNLQTWSVIAVEDPVRKDKAATLCGNQDFIRQSPLFLVFCADLNRLTNLSEKQQSAGEGLEFTEMFLMASIDASLAAQNASVAAESLGLGTCYVGAARNHSRELAELLQLPQRVIALFGLAVGKPDDTVAASAAVKPRLGQDEVLHRETWSVDSEAQSRHVTKYDATLANFDAQQQRTGALAWTHRSARRVASASSLSGRHILRQVLEERGFNLR